MAHKLNKIYTTFSVEILSELCAICYRQFYLFRGNLTMVEVFTIFNSRRLTKRILATDMVKDYFTARYVAEVLDIEVEEAQHKLGEERLFTILDLKTLEYTSGIVMEKLIGQLPAEVKYD